MIGTTIKKSIVIWFHNAETGIREEFTVTVPATHVVIVLEGIKELYRRTHRICADETVKIEAVKFARTNLGIGLRDAKHLIEKIIDDMSDRTDAITGLRTDYDEDVPF